MDLTSLCAVVVYKILTVLGGFFFSNYYFFVGGGSNIAIATALPPSLVHCSIAIKHQIVYGFSPIYFFMLAWGFGFWMWRLTLASRVLFLLSAEYSAVMCGAWPGTLVTWPYLLLSMKYCCALRLSSQICVTCRRYWFPDSVTLSCCAGARCLGPEGWLDT